MNTTGVGVPAVDGTVERLMAGILAKRREDALRAAEMERLNAPPPVVEVREAPKVEPVKDGKRNHYRFPLFLKAVEAGVTGIALVGPAGTGKTTAAAMAAKSTGRMFEAVSFGPTTSKSDMFGFVDANGTYRDTGLVRAAVNGGLFLGDEFDAGHAGIAVGLNMVAANEVFSTPDGMKARHERFTLVVGMNTYGNGASRQYVGRNQMDAATMDRFCFIDWPLDEGLEAHMVGVTGLKSPECNIGQGGTLSPVAWFKRVTAVRAAVAKLGVQHVVSPRCTSNGAKLFAVGVGKEWVEAMCLWKGMDAATRAKVEANV